PPSLGLLTLNVLAAANTVLIPIQCEYYGLEGISQLLNTVRLVQQNFNTRLAISGVLLTMYDARLNLCRQVAEDAKEYFGEKMFVTPIPRNVRLAELVASIQTSGLLQPVVVRPWHGAYELIAGERRWRAATRLGWAKIPAVVKDVDDQTLLTLALVENLQRDNLSPIDEAAGYQRLGAEFKLPQSEVARLVGRNRATVANLLRLLQLPAEVQALVHERKLSEGHARALPGLAEAEAMIALARQAVDEGWSVREMEARVRGDAPASPMAAPTPPPRRARP